MAKILLGKVKTDSNGRATFTYTGANRGIVGITAVADGNVSNEIKILDYNLRAVTDVDVDGGVLTTESISSSEIDNDTRFVVDVDHNEGTLTVTKDNINTDDPSSIVSEIDFQDGTLIIRDMADVLRWL